MDRKRFARFLERDRSCYATGVSGETLIPQHRCGGMGGNRRETPAAIITFDAVTNNLIETDSWWQKQAYRNGWKLHSHLDPTTTPVWHRRRGWLMLDDEFGIRPATHAEVGAWLNYLKEMGW